MRYELHPLCTLFPRLSGAEFDALRDDIRANGLRTPIVLHEGMILDGGNRYRACLEAGVEPEFVEFDGENLVSFVLSANLHRRHMTAGQQAAIVASAQDWAKAQPAHRPQKAGNLAPLSTLADRAAHSGASERTQKMADKVAKADPELVKRVAHGEVSLPAAVEQITGKRPGKPPARSAKAPAPAAAAPSEPPEDDDRPSTGELLEDLQRDVERLTAQVKALSAGDQGAELLKQIQIKEHLERARDDEMAKNAKLVEQRDFYMRQLRRCGRAVGQEDLDRIAAAVEAFVRAHKKVAA